MTKEELVDAFEEYGELIFKYIYVRVGSKEQAEDIASEVFLKAWENKKKFDSKKASLKTWLFVIARNLIIDSYRKKKTDSFNLDNFEVLDRSNEIEKEVLLDYVLKKVKMLTETDQELIIMRYVNQLEINEISEIINKNYNTTKVAIHRSLLNLKKIVNERN